MLSTNNVKIFFLSLILLFSSFAVAQNIWDLRAISNQNTLTSNLYRTDKTLYTNVSVTNARMLRDIADKLSLQSGIYPTLSLKESNDINASAGYIDGSPVIIINKPMLDIVGNDTGIAAALLGHEMAHLYLKHNESSATNQAIGNALALIAGVALEILAERKLGITNLGLNAGSAIGTIYVATFTRDQEREADKQGTQWAISNGYDAYGAVRLFTTLENKSGNSLITFFQTHPNPGERIENTKQLIASYKVPNADIKVAANAIPPELIALNTAINEDIVRQTPKSEEAKKGVMAFTKKDFSEAKTYFEKCASSNEASCQNNLGVLYANGLGVDLDAKKALSYYKLASDQKLAIGMTNYSGLVARGVAGPIDNAKGIELIQLVSEAAQLGSPAAMGSLAYMGQQDYGKAVNDLLPSPTVLGNYAKASAMRGNKDGIMALGQMYRTGYGGVDKNIDLAEKYLIEAANKKDGRADAGLYVIYTKEKVDEVKANNIKQRIILQKENGSISALAKDFCGTNFFNRDSKQCYEWTKLGAESGILSLIRSYGLLLYRGIGVDKDKLEGAAWIVYAKNRGDPQAIDMVNKNASDYTAEEMDRINAKALAISNQIASKSVTPAQ